MRKQFGDVGRFVGRRSREDVFQIGVRVPDYDSLLILVKRDGKQDCLIANFGFAPAEYAPAGMPNPVNARAEIRPWSFRQEIVSNSQHR